MRRVCVCSCVHTGDEGRGGGGGGGGYSLVPCPKDFSEFRSCVSVDVKQQ